VRKGSQSQGEPQKEKEEGGWKHAKQPIHVMCGTMLCLRVIDAQMKVDED